MGAEPSEPVMNSRMLQLTSAIPVTYPEGWEQLVEWKRVGEFRGIPVYESATLPPGTGQLLAGQTEGEPTFHVKPETVWTGTIPGPASEEDWERVQHAMAEHVRQRMEELSREVFGLPPEEGMQGYYVPTGTRRWKRLRVSGRVVARLLGGFGRGGLRNIPSDAIVVGARMVDDTGDVLLTLESGRFPPVGEGAEPPDL